MMTVDEIESACDAGHPPEFLRHEQQAGCLALRGLFYPCGFPTEVRTNNSEVLELAAELWGQFTKQSDTEAIRIDVHVAESDSTESPPLPMYRIIHPYLMSVADGENYSVADLERSATLISVNDATMRDKLYMGSMFLNASPGPHISTRYTTAVHAACVSLGGRGVLLCGDSGAGKSSLSYACARAGFTYVSDDASFLLHGEPDRTLIGNCHQVRFRPTAAELFPELKSQGITPRLTGKPSIELPTAPMAFTRAQTTTADFIVFLNRHSGAPPELRAYRKDIARYYMRQHLWTPEKFRTVQHETIERFLKADVFELRYTEMDWAVERLQRLVQEGR